MALTRDKKAEVISELEQLFADSKMTVVAKYQGLTVKSIQELRIMARENGTTIKVVKNRLVRKAIENTDALKSADTSQLRDMLMYVFNPNETFASLPSKPELIAGVVSLLQSPVRGVMGQLQGNLHGLLDAVSAKASN